MERIRFCLLGLLTLSSAWATEPAATINIFENVPPASLEQVRNDAIPKHLSPEQIERLLDQVKALPPDARVKISLGEPRGVFSSAESGSVLILRKDLPEFLKTIDIESLQWKRGMLNRMSASDQKTKVLIPESSAPAWIVSPSRNGTRVH